MRKNKNESGLTLSKEKILESYRLSAKMKLIWLEETNKFIKKIKRARVL